MRCFTQVYRKPYSLCFSLVWWYRHAPTACLCVSVDTDHDANATKLSVSHAFPVSFSPPLCAHQLCILQKEPCFFFFPVFAKDLSLTTCGEDENFGQMSNTNLWTIALPCCLTVAYPGSAFSNPELQLCVLESLTRHHQQQRGVLDDKWEMGNRKIFVLLYQ